MKAYKECKEIAVNYAESYGVTINHASELPTVYIFDDKDNEYEGIIPFAVDKETGNISGLWLYLQGTEYTMDDMTEIDFGADE